MSSISAKAFLLRRIDHGDYDLILTFFSAEGGKISTIAKYAKKSKKRFAGVLELFSLLKIISKKGRGNLPYLQEAYLEEPFAKIRSDIQKTAYASYWAEVLITWLEEGQRQVALFDLFNQVLHALNNGEMPNEFLSIFFQIRFLALTGLLPNLTQCNHCRIELDQMQTNQVIFDLAMGGLVCKRCSLDISNPIYLSKGTVKQLRWVCENELPKAFRIRFSSLSQKEGLNLLEAFVPYHLGKFPRSLAFLQKIR